MPHSRTSNGVEPVGLGTLLERTWSGLTGRRRRPSAPTLFRLAERYRNEGRYEDAAALIAQGLEQAPQSRVGHLLSAYLHLTRREIEPAKLALSRVLKLDPYHPRALLGLARIGLEEGDLEGAKTSLDRALQLYPDFPEAQALRQMVGSGSPPRDVLAMHADGTLVSAQGGGEATPAFVQHLTLVYRMASATLARAGLGPLRRAVVQTEAEQTFLLSDTGLLLSATLDGDVEADAGFAQLERLRTRLAVNA
jgi:tetratricopeptide (TPR) repeat protein